MNDIREIWFLYYNVSVSISIHLLNIPVSRKLFDIIIVDAPPPITCLKATHLYQWSIKLKFKRSKLISILKLRTTVQTWWYLQWDGYCHYSKADAESSFRISHTERPTVAGLLLAIFARMRTIYALLFVDRVSGALSTSWQPGGR